MQEERYESPISGKSSLLIKEKPIILLPELAIRIGPDLAIIVQQIQYWLEQKEKSQTQRTFLEGRYWVYNTIKDWSETNFPWWREDQLRRYFEALIESGIVIAKKFEAKEWKQRKWYTLDYEVLDRLAESKIKVKDIKSQSVLVDTIKQLAILPKDLANSPNQCGSFRQIEPDDFAKSSILTETTSEITSETTLLLSENEKVEIPSGLDSSQHPLGSDSRGASQDESNKSRNNKTKGGKNKNLISKEVEQEYQPLLDLYNQEKPPAWDKAHSLTNSRLTGLQRYEEKYGRDRMVEMMRRALLGAKRTKMATFPWSIDVLLKDDKEWFVQFVEKTDDGEIDSPRAELANNPGNEKVLRLMEKHARVLGIIVPREVV